MWYRICNCNLPNCVHLPGAVEVRREGLPVQLQLADFNFTPFDLGFWFVAHLPGAVEACRERFPVQLQLADATLRAAVGEQAVAEAHLPSLNERYA